MTLNVKGLDFFLNIIIINLCGLEKNEKHKLLFLVRWVRNYIIKNSPTQIKTLKE